MVDNRQTKAQIIDAATDQNERLLAAYVEINRLRELCAAYRGQVEAGAAEIERLRAALERIRYMHGF